MRLLVETIHVALGLVAAVMIGALSAWSYPLARHDIWHVTYAGMAIVLAMGVRPMVQAYRDDLRGLRETREKRGQAGHG